MQASTSIEPDSTETQTIPQERAEEVIQHHSGENSGAPAASPGTAVLVFDSENLPRNNPLCIVIDIPKEERKRTTRLYNRMARGELPPAQDSSSLE